MLSIRKQFCTKLSHSKQYYAKAITERVPQSEGINYFIDTTVVQLDDSRRITPSLMMELMPINRELQLLFRKHISAEEHLF